MFPARSALHRDEGPCTPVHITTSRRSSLKNPCAPSGQAMKRTDVTSSVSTSYISQAPDSSSALARDDSTSSRRRPRSLMGSDISNLDFLTTDPTIRSSRTHCKDSKSNTMRQRSASCREPTRASMQSTKVRRWEGHTRTAGEWDGLRRDPELWFEDGDCLVHLYARGRSRRGPSFCVPFETLTQYQCGSMFSLCFAQITEDSGTDPTKSRRLSNSLAAEPTGSNQVELYIPAPEALSKDDAFRWHITTRNFFAFVFNKPLVGEGLGITLVDLHERLMLFRSGRINNQEDLLEYIDGQGYRDFVDYPDYALAVLYYAEHYKLREIWIDAFAHCVGMNESLAASREFASLSSLTRALIMRAYLDMDIQLGKVTASVRNFLEDDLSPNNIGLSDGARGHLDRFRAFLQGFYAKKFGYWPPPEGLCFPMAMFRSLYNDFQNLYAYLVDEESTADLTAQRPASGGICVLQNIELFDKRHNFPSLSHPLPLLPNEAPLRGRTDSQRSLKNLALASKLAKTDRYLAAHAALMSAANTRDVLVTSSPIVKAYRHFERQVAQNLREDKVTITDARKARWILIYGTLQHLLSALRVPNEVRDTVTPTYPLCCLVTEQSYRQAGTKTPAPLASTAANDVSETISSYHPVTAQASENSLSKIQPDCQTQSYFTHTNTDSNTRPISVEVPAPLKISQSTRNSSVCSFRRLSKSIPGSTRNSIQPKLKTHPDSLVHGHVNSIDETIAALQSQHSLRRHTMTAPLPACLSEPISQKPTPILTKFNSPASVSEQIPNITPTEMFRPQSSNGSTDSMHSPTWSDPAGSVSSQSSIRSRRQSLPSPLATKNYGAVEGSGLLGGLVSIYNVSSTSTKPPVESSSPASPSARHITHGGFNFGFETLESPRERALSVANTNALGNIVVNSQLKTSLPIDATNTGPHRRTSSADTCYSLSDKSLRSISLESLRVVAAVEAMSPLRSDPVSGGLRKKKSMMDIYSALELQTPSSTKENHIEKSPRPTNRKSETAQSVLDAIPPPIVMTVPYSEKGHCIKTIPYSSTGTRQKKKTNTNIQEKEKVKISRRISFWKR